MYSRNNQKKFDNLNYGLVNETLYNNVKIFYDFILISILVC